MNYLNISVRGVSNGYVVELNDNVQVCTNKEDLLKVIQGVIFPVYKADELDTKD